MRLLPLDITMTTSLVNSARTNVDKGGVFNGISARVKIAAAVVFATPVAIAYHALGTVIKAVMFNKDCAKHLDIVFKLALGALLLGTVGLLRAEIGLDLYDALHLVPNGFNRYATQTSAVITNPDAPPAPAMTPTAPAMTPAAPAMTPTPPKLAFTPNRGALLGAIGKFQPGSLRKVATPLAAETTTAKAETPAHADALRAAIAAKANRTPSPTAAAVAKPVVAAELTELQVKQQERAARLAAANK